MARQTVIKNSFNSGEFSPLMLGRTDLGEYLRASRLVENWHLAPQGALIRRSGSRFVGEVQDSDAKTRLWPFVVSDLQAYVLEFGNLYIRVYTLEGQLVQQILLGLVAEQDVSSISDEFTSAGHGYSDGDGPVRISTDTTLPTPLIAAADYFIRLPLTTTFVPADVSITNDEITVSGGHKYSDQQGPFRLTTSIALPAGLSTVTDYFIVRVTDTTFGLSLAPGGGKEDMTDIGTGVHTLTPTTEYLRNKFRLSDTSSGTTFIDLSDPGTGIHAITPQAPISPVQITSPYTTAEIFDLHFAQSADVLFIAHPSHPPAKLTRFSVAGFGLEDVDFIDGPYLDENLTDTTMSVGAISGTGVELTASTAIFVGSDVGRPVRIRTADPGDDVHWGWGKITSVAGVTWTDTDIETFLFDFGDVSTGNDEITAPAAHGMDTGEVVRFKEDGSGALPTAIPVIVEGTNYFVRAVSSTILAFFTSRADAIADDDRIVISAQGSGTNHRITSSVIDVGAHGYSGGEGPVQLTNTGGALPVPLLTGTDYFIGFVDINSFTLSLSRGGAVQGIETALGTGSHTAHGTTVPQAVCTIEVRDDFNTDSVAVPAWRLGAWSSDPFIGFPATVTFDKNRLWWAANAGGPQTLYGSKANDFETHSPTGNIVSDAELDELSDAVNDNNGIVYTLGADKVNVINWIRSTRSLLAGTTSANWADRVPLDQATSPGNFKMRKSVDRGASSLAPVAADNRVLYVSQTGLKVFSLGYEFEGDDYEAEDTTILAEHITRSGILDSDFAPEPFSQFHAVRADGEIATLTTVRQQEIAGWGRHILGGSDVVAFDQATGAITVDLSADTVSTSAGAPDPGWENGQRVRWKITNPAFALPEPFVENLDYYVRRVADREFGFYATVFDALNDENRIDITSTGGNTHSLGAATAAVVESVAVIPSPAGDPSDTGRENRAHDQVWIIVRRTVDSVTVRHIEFFEDHFAQDDAPGADKLEDGFFLDCGGTYNVPATPSATVTVLHLAGETVDVLADGVRYRDLVASATDPPSRSVYRDI